MRRREIVAGIAAATAGWPLRARAQRPAKLPTVGFLGANAEAAQARWTGAFVQRLAELGWIEGRTIALEFRFAAGDFARSSELIAELVGLDPDVIVTHATANVLAAKRATSTIPIVFALAGDPVRNNLVTSLARPGGNVTGLSLQQSELAGKRLELLRAVVPDLRRLAILVLVGNPNTLLEMEEARIGARELGLEIDALQIERLEEITGIEALKGKVDALYVPQDPRLTADRGRINALAREARLATIYDARDRVEAGGLMSYGPYFPDLFRRAGDLVDKILRGTKPADIPVEQPTRFELVINLKTAEALGLAIPPTILARTDEVIE